MAKLVVLGLFLFIACIWAAANPTVTQFDDCGSTCTIVNVLFPSPTRYVALMNNGRVYTSKDEGQTWKLLWSNVLAMDSFQTDPMAIVFVVQVNGVHTTYYSNDGGDTVATGTRPPATILKNYSLHPTKVGWFLVLACPSSCQVYYTSNYGSTWQAGPTTANYPVAWSNDPATPNTMFAIKSDGSFGYTLDFGRSWVPVVTNSIGFAFTENYLYVGQNLGGGRARLYSSSDRLDASHLNKGFYWPAEFPGSTSLPEYGYTFLDDAARSEFVAVKQNKNNAWGTVYASDFDGDQFALSLDYVAEDDLYYDFDKFNGLNGIYLANAYPTPSSTQRQTKFTYDNGGDWKFLTAPATNYNGAPTNCALANGCSLHLHGILSWFNGTQPPYYSSPNAIGLMIAVGNTGTQLLNDDSQSSTFFTRDGGITWVELFNQPTIYEFGDHGGILVFATTNSATSRLYYSLNEGKDISSFNFAGTAIYVDNIFTEPMGKSQKFVLVGHLGNRQYIYSIDFSSLNLPTCGPDDYEDWAPSNNDNKNQNCFMGATTYYSRRKQDSKCFNDRDTDQLVNSTSCACDWEDYECDINYTPSIRDDNDKFTCTANEGFVPPPCATGFRLIPDTQCKDGLQMGATDCPGYSGSPTTTGDPSSTTSTGSTGLPVSSTTSVSTTGKTSGDDKKKKTSGGVVFVIILFVLIFGASAVAGVMYWKNDRFREFVQEKLFRRGAGEQSYGRLNTDVDDGDDLVN